jgi:hypothetical protein
VRSNELEHAPHRKNQQTKKCPAAVAEQKELSQWKHKHIKSRAAIAIKQNPMPVR